MDTETIASLFHQYGDDVFRLAYSYLGNRPDAEDVCQTVFLKLMQQKEITQGSLRRWTIPIAAKLWRKKN